MVIYRQVSVDIIIIKKLLTTFTKNNGFTIQIHGKVICWKTCIIWTNNIVIHNTQIALDSKTILLVARRDFNFCWTCSMRKVWEKIVVSDSDLNVISILCKNWIIIVSRKASMKEFFYKEDYNSSKVERAYFYLLRTTYNFIFYFITL